MLNLRPALFAAGLCLALSPTALAQRNAPITQGVTSSDMAGRLQQLQQQNAALRLEVSDMQAEMAELNGKIETLEFLLSQSRDEINRMQGDDAEIGRQLSQIMQKMDALTGRIEEVELRLANTGTQAGSLVGAEPPATSGDGSRTVTVRNRDGTVTRRVVGESQDQAGTTPSGDTGSPGEPAQTGYLGTISAADLPGESGPLFAEAKDRLRQFDFAGAEVAFRAFLDRFGDDPQAGEAQYWLGEVLYQQDEYEAAGAAYTELIQTYPQDPRAPDALVKLARSMRLIGETDRACAALDALPRSYPEASTVTMNLAAVERTRSACDS